MHMKLLLALSIEHSSCPLFEPKWTWEHNPIEVFSEGLLVIDIEL